MAGERLWKSRSVETPKQGFHCAWKSPKGRGIPTFPQPRRRRSIDLKPDISCATKTGHFNLLTTSRSETGGDSNCNWMERTGARPKSGRPLQNLPPTPHGGFAAAVTCFPGRNGHLYGQNELLPQPPNDHSGALLASSSLLKGITPGISHLVHMSSILLWKYSMSSFVKWAKRPCFNK